jgi:hypothetical protein
MMSGRNRVIRGHFWGDRKRLSQRILIPIPLALVKKEGSLSEILRFEAQILNDIKSKFDSHFWLARATIELSPGGSKR